MFCEEGKSQCQLKLTLGLVCDHTVAADYVALQSYADAFVPSRPYFGSELLPMTWTASILGDKYRAPAQESVVPAATGEPVASAEEPEAELPSGEAIQRGCPALLGGPLLLAPRPPAILAGAR